ncbi:LysR family transcriptional regulator [Ornithinibacillus halotolerans]|uniref:HTH-type transcriptional regulator CitR n=1 Tax=Ornithinibacillus halotolerans TaxID=1274357 RepID=A0A916RPF8_9BACI|nr:LysR family transcriptional regulator [Ornithinibacillus halotolerans]GGA61901.1 HTH-type transcriptional regulator CitR [Ornithinibacillus halotolerans]
MDIRMLKTFILAAKLENYREVAEKLYMTQPAITFQMKQLEKELGGQLFIKEGRNIVLSDFGRMFYEEALDLLSQYEKSVHRMNQYKQGFHQHIRIAMSPFLADTILPSIFNRYMKANPTVELSIQVMESHEISACIEKGNADLGLSCLPGSSLVQTTIFHEEEVILVVRHDGYDAESGPILDASEIIENNIIFTDNHPFYWNDLSEQLKHMFPTVRTMKVNQSYVTKRFILEGMGVSFLPRSSVNKELAEGRLLEVPTPAIHIPRANMYFVYKNNKHVEMDLIPFIASFHFS